MLKNKKKLLSSSLALLSSVSLMSSLSYARSELTVSSSGAPSNPLGDLSSVGAVQRVTSPDLSLRFRASCYATNLRGVSNPVSPSSIIEMSGKLSINNAAPTDFKIRFPSHVVLSGGMAGADTADLDMSTAVGLPAGAKLAASGNMVVLKLGNADVAKIDPVTAKISQTKNVFNVSNVAFYQYVTTTPKTPTVAEYNDYVNYARARGNHVHSYDEYKSQVVNRTYSAKEGWMSGSNKITKSSDGKIIDIDAAFPGEPMFCGGYYSPLMVFFDANRPKFNNIVDFNMNTGLKTYWPEKSHQGYFVALPKNGKVSSVDQLFGESKDYDNGFDNLAQHDKNKDGVIDAKDPVFKKLVLWKDNSGKGLYNAKDTLPLHKKVKSISLAYNPNIENVGEGAEFRQKGKFQFYSSTGKVEQGEIIDVWFKPALGTEKEAQERKLSSLGQ